MTVKKMKTFDQQKTAIVLVGPTAVGKSALALKLAERFNTSIISADSRQCYRELNIGTAKPSPEDLQRVRHYFINSHSITEDVNAGLFENLSMDYIGEIFQENDIAIICGGTGLYVEAFCEGLDEMAPIPEGIRNQVRKLYLIHGIEGLHKELEEKDPEYFKNAEIHNPHRLMRALEVFEATGQSIVTFRKKKLKPRDFNIIKIGLQLPKEQLWDHIVHRTYHMISSGLVEEVRSLIHYHRRNALQTVGYAEIFKYLAHKCALNEAIGDINIHTRQYAKRQMTWFRKDSDIRWFSGNDPESYFLHYINKELVKVSGHGVVAHE